MDRGQQHVSINSKWLHTDGNGMCEAGRDHSCAIRADGDLNARVLRRSSALLPPSGTLHGAAEPGAGKIEGSHRG